MKPIIKLADVSYWYPNTTQPAVEKLSLEIPCGDFLLVAGSSGSGKSTLCRMLNGLVPRFSGGRFAGAVSVCGFNTLRHPTSGIAAKVGMVFQDPENQFITDDVENEVAFGLENLATPPDEMKARVEESLKQFGVIHLKNAKTASLSGGEKQRVILASIIAMQPELIVLDEPTSQLDPVCAREFIGHLAKLNKEFETTVVLSEHRIKRVLPHATSVLDLDENKLVSTNTFSVKYVKKPTYSVKKPVYSVKPRPAIEIKNLHHTINERKILAAINLVFQKGEFTAIVGANGSGKTTLVRHLNGLITPQEGAVVVDGVDTRKTTTEELSKTVGYLGQNPNDYLHADTVAGEVEFTLNNLGIKRDVSEVLSIVGMSGKKDRYPRDLSGGERSRTALASVLAADPQIIVLDEPTRGLDFKAKAKLMEFLNKLRDGGKTIILVTHDIPTIINRVDRVVVLKDGGVELDGRPKDTVSKTNFLTEALA